MQQIVRISAADVGVRAGKPALLDLFGRRLRRRPEGCLVRGAMFVDRHGVVCTAYRFAQRRVMKPVRRAR